ncbi:MAG: Hsp70 family protein [Acidobacteria bacterium]|nr:Hsp70 family protein [Acidobacteriota bacterium]
MRLGIDFGTTRTVVCAVDHGAYPVIGFDTGAGEHRPWYPSLLALSGDRVLAGWRAEALRSDPKWTLLHSFKRWLADAGPESTLEVAGEEWRRIELLARFLRCLREDLRERSSLETRSRKTFDVLVAVPANAASGQRFVTLEAFRQAGFRVLGLINEPSAAGIEYAHRFGTRSGARRKEKLLVYDLGGGTFDASVVRITGRHHEILANDGVPRLGGDDFDAELLALALETADLPGPGALPEGARDRLLEHCRRVKEGIHANTQKLVVDLGSEIPGAGRVTVAVRDFDARCAPLVERTLFAVESAIARCSDGARAEDLAGIYRVGGASELPLVGRMLRRHWGNKVRLSPEARSATALGLALAADASSGVTLRERFTRYFGVWREAEEGRRVAFDAIFPKDAPLPAPGEEPLVFRRRYRPIHTIGHFRYLECTEIDEHGQPAGSLTPWSEIYFPFHPALRDADDLDRRPIGLLPRDHDQQIEEQYTCDAQGVMEVTLKNRTHGYKRTYRLRG